jgi:hypothetical protein
MTDPDPRADGANPPQADTTEPEFSLQYGYLKDCSFEAPRGPRIEGQWSPAVNLDLNTAAEAISPERLAGFDEESVAALARRLEDDDYPTPFAGLQDWHLLRALAIHRPDLARPYLHLVDQEPFDED